MKRKSVFVLFLSLFLGGLGFGQDLNRLQGRAQKLLELRSPIDINKTAAAQYIEAPYRQQFLESRPFPMTDAQVVGLEFSSDPKLVYVIFKAKVILPQIGPVPRTGREPWVWDKKDWFLRIEDLGNPFLESKNAPPVRAAKPLPLEFSPTRLDLGKHTQGEVLKGSLSFKSDKEQISLFRLADLPGLSFDAPVWKSNEEGQIDFQLDTALFFQDVHYVAEFEVDGVEAQVTHAAFELVAQIEPRLKITQEPSVIDPTATGPVEIRIENLSNAPFSFKSVFLASDSYRVVKEPPDTVSPGQTAIIAYLHTPQDPPIGAQLNLELSEPVVGKRRLTFPLKVKMPEPVRPGYTREQLDEIVRRNKP
jgi:hypothetical protein